MIVEHLLGRLVQRQAHHLGQRDVLAKRLSDEPGSQPMWTGVALWKACRLDPLVEDKANTVRCETPLGDCVVAGDFPEHEAVVNFSDPQPLGHQTGWIGALGWPEPLDAKLI